MGSPIVLVQERLWRLLLFRHLWRKQTWRACSCHAEHCFTCWILQRIKETPWLQHVYILEGVGTGNKQTNMRSPSGKAGKRLLPEVWMSHPEPGGRETVGHAGIWEMSVSHKGSSKDWGPEMGLLMGCLRKTVWGTSSALIETWGEEGRCVRLREFWWLDNPWQCY